MKKDRDTKSSPPIRGDDNPTGNTGDLYDETKGHPHGGQHAGRQGAEGQHQQRPKHEPSDPPDDK
jgi:hypothetical protein